MTRPNPFKLPELKTLGVLVHAAALALALAGPGCSSTGSACGAGTHLDAASNTCLPDPPSNVIVDDFSLGEFKLTNVDVPEQLQVGTLEERTFTITNEGKEKRSVVSIRYGLVPVEKTISELEQQLEAMTDGSEIDATFLGNVLVDDLAAGASTDVTYYLNAPETIKDGLYGLFFAIDEVPIIKDDAGNYAVDYSVAGVGESAGESRLTSAALVKAIATVIVGVPDKPNLRVLSASIDNSSFLLDESALGDTAMFTVSGRLSAQGKDITEAVQVGFALKLPGHAMKTAGKDLGESWFGLYQADYAAAPDVTTYVYDADRKFVLHMQETGGQSPFKLYSESCEIESLIDEATGEAADHERCAVLFNDRGKDDVYELHLSNEDLALLGHTKRLAALNPGLDANDELKGTVVMTAVTDQEEYEDNVADNEKSFDVVFMAPEKGPDASATDTSDEASAQPNSWGASGPYAFVSSEAKAGTTYGNEWFGASYNFASKNTHDLQNGTRYKQDNSDEFSLDGMILKQKFPILAGGASSDSGSDKGIEKWDAAVYLKVGGYAIFDAEFDPKLCVTEDDVTACDIFSTSEIGAEKETKDPSEVADTKDKKTPAKKGRSLSVEYEFRFMAGPVPLLILAEFGVSSGFGMAFRFIVDSRGPVPKYGVEFAAGPYLGFGGTLFGGVSLAVARAGVEGNLTLLDVSFTPTISLATALLYDLDKGCIKYAGANANFSGPLTLTGPSGDVSIVAYAGKDVCALGVCVGEVKVFSLKMASFNTFTKTWNLWNFPQNWTIPKGDTRLCSDAIDTPEGRQWQSPTPYTGASGTKYYGHNSSTNPVGGGTPNVNNVNSAYKTTYSLAGTVATCMYAQWVGRTEPVVDRLVFYDDKGNAVNTETFTATRQVCKKYDGNGNCKPKEWKEEEYTTTRVGWSGTTKNPGEVRHILICSPSVTAALETDKATFQTGGKVLMWPKL